MAKDAHDREDLLRDATGYVARMEFRLPGVEPNVFSGFRDDGAWSLYWGQADVVQFNASGALRRAFWQDRLLASYQHRLHWLHRDGTARASLTREPLSEASQASFLQLWEDRLQQLQSTLAEGRHEVIGCVPADLDVTVMVVEWLSTHPAPLELAMHPGLKR